MAFRIDTPVLHTERLTLRPPCSDDIPVVQREFGRWEIVKHLSAKVPWPYPPDGAHHWFHEMVKPLLANKTEAIWAITKRDGPDELIGVIHIMEDTGLGNRGFWLAESEQNKGYMTEAASAVSDYVFAHTPMTELYVYNAIENTASRRVKEKAGAELVREVPCAHRSGNGISEVWIIRKEAWLKARV